jgi:Uma2 family endonuclease
MFNEVLAERRPAETETEESGEMGSHNHSAIQANITYLLKRAEKYSVYTELSLDTTTLDPQKFKFKDEIKPDVCVYPKRGLIRPFDILKMSEMPLLAIEVLSPKQSAYEILEKFAAYFALGVKSCWLVDPLTAVVSVYSALDVHQNFTAGEVVDPVIGLQLPFDEIFE